MSLGLYLAPLVITIKYSVILIILLFYFNLLAVSTHFALPLSYVVDATLRWEIAKTQQCGTEKTKIL